MTDEELERLKNVNVDLSSVLKAATEVDPAKVVRAKHTGLRKAVAHLGYTVYGTTIRPFGPEEHGRLKDAIKAVDTTITRNGNFPLCGKVEHVVMRASMLLADLNAVPKRKATGADSLVSECEELARLLPE